MIKKQAIYVYEKINNICLHTKSLQTTQNDFSLENHVYSNTENKRWFVLVSVVVFENENITNNNKQTHGRVTHILRICDRYDLDMSRTSTGFSVLKK